MQINLLHDRRKLGYNHFLRHIHILLVHSGKSILRADNFHRGLYVRDAGSNAVWLQFFDHLLHVCLNHFHLLRHLSHKARFLQPTLPQFVQETV